MIVYKSLLFLIPDKIKLIFLFNQLNIIGPVGTISICKYVFIKHNCIAICTANSRFVLAKLSNSVKGVLNGHMRWLILKGIGYKVINSSGNLVFKLGLSHNIVYRLPKEVNVLLYGNKIKLVSVYLNNVSLTASLIKNLKLPDIYQGKGILYREDKLILKIGKRK